MNPLMRNVAKPVSSQFTCLQHRIGAPFGLSGELRAHSCPGPQQFATHHPEIGQRKQRVQLRGVLGQTSVAHLDVPVLVLENTEGMFDPCSNACLHALVPIGQGIDRFGQLQQAAFARPHGNVPGLASPGIGPFARTLVAGVGIDILVVGPHQTVGLDHVVDCTSGAAHRVNQARVNIHSNVTLHARSTTAGLCGFASSPGRVRRCCSWSNWARQSRWRPLPCRS